MTKLLKPKESGNGLIESVNKPINRKSFFKFAGAGAALTTLLLSGCNDDDDGKFNGVVDTPPTPPTPGPTTVSLGSGDVGVLNYAYALEQLEAAFYTQVVASTTFNATFPDAKERQTLTDIRDHEIAHREFFKAALTAAAPAAIIPGLTPNFSSINFGDRTAVLNAAKTFEDLGVSAYNGAGKLLTTPDFLVLAGKIVSVEARHAAEIRDLISNGTFADTGNNDKGFDLVADPATVLGAAKSFVKETIDFSKLPTS
ncbi:Tat (twin-arginine translocation) pathway signal sequence containing protein [Adhaeribacter arboris]|uniref:Tat (Twin-arginine translocation) pathway signal sequence containing protein n=1 Tax=Adhaeribacter arboris TaxID=2072846 RepID=A0A2T2Y9L9_9BACT|nr:ferritin-like domain-containing protein [Adhaeribacter arboris]PSR52203.1 Tat (twin-arginine translocation) pathway signal sequence containing protein [Adhaeribacter arboris]